MIKSKVSNQLVSHDFKEGLIKAVEQRWDVTCICMINIDSDSMFKEAYREHLSQ